MSKNKKPVDSMDLLKEGEEKDYISFLMKCRKGVGAGATDLVAGVGTTLFEV